MEEILEMYTYELANFNTLVLVILGPPNSVVTPSPAIPIVAKSVGKGELSE